MKALDRRLHRHHSVGAGRLFRVRPGEQYACPGKVVAYVVLFGDLVCLAGIVQRETVLMSQRMLRREI
ncbi:hypothetical protein D3C72_2140640 [compost metagenome]